MSKITPCLWFDGQAEEAANFYASVLPDSVFTMPVLMALLTTVMTTPALLWLTRTSPDPEPREGPVSGPVTASSAP